MVREENVLRVFENGVVGECVCVYVRREWEKVRNEELRDSVD
jgi:hypothetical protein